MIQRFDTIAVDLPVPDSANPAAAAAVQELMGGKFGEMSTLMNYTFQSFNFRGKKQYRPFYDLLCNIATEEYSHIEAVAAAINLLLTGATPRVDRNDSPLPKALKSKTAKARTKPPTTSGKADPAPLAAALGTTYPYHFLAGAQSAMPFDSMGNPWTGSYVTATGNLKMDLLHNFFLECGARAGKMRVYEMCDDPTARAMVGYLLVRGGVHIVAYAKALEKLTGANVGQLLPIPDVSNKKFPEAMKHEANGVHRIMWHFSPEDYTELDQIWNGPHPEDGEELEFRVNEMPPAFPWPEAPDEPQLVSPGAIDPDMIKYFAKKLE
ncbi:MAG TPA: manganese catalase family protein [Chthoniobacterales bacterium]|nr:manganese catalase family protein [Chthoniobacterales bacterium]